MSEIDRRRDASCSEINFMKTRFPPLFASLFLFVSAAAGAPNELPPRVLLWPDGAPGSEGKSGDEQVRITDAGDHVVSNIHRPCLFPYLPVADRATGAAVVIAPGGGHRELWTTHEGHNIARWLSEHGVAAFVLYYRLAREKDSTYTVDETALKDTQRAIQLVRSRAGEWHVNPARIGVMGFSAGGELAALADMHFKAAEGTGSDAAERSGSKPDFQALIYPGSSARFEVRKDSSPVFIACGYKDRPDISKGMAELYLKYKEAGVPAELHIYAQAGHGFGLQTGQTGAVAMWPGEFLAWLGDLGLLKQP
jgi:acetyl esterase/lipase